MHLILTISLLTTLARPLWAAEGDDCDGNCGQLPAPSACTEERKQMAQAQKILLKDMIKEKALNFQGTPEQFIESVQKELNLYAEFGNFFIKCHHGTGPNCNDDSESMLNFSFYQTLEKGWIKTTLLNFRGNKDKCALDVKRSIGLATITSPDKKPILELSSDPNSRSGYSFLPKVKIPCKLVDSSYETYRQLSMSEDRITVVDWTPDAMGVDFERHVKSNVEFKPGATIHTSITPEGNFRLQWDKEEGAPYLDYAKDGQLIDSNFLNLKSWANGQCQTTTGKSKGKTIYYPADVSIIGDSTKIHAVTKPQ